MQEVRFWTGEKLCPVQDDLSRVVLSGRVSASSSNAVLPVSDATYDAGTTASAREGSNFRLRATTPTTAPTCNQNTGTACIFGKCYTDMGNIASAEDTGQHCVDYTAWVNAGSCYCNMCFENGACTIASPTAAPTTSAPTNVGDTFAPTTGAPTTFAPTTAAPTTSAPTTDPTVCHDMLTTDPKETGIRCSLLDKLNSWGSTACHGLDNSAISNSTCNIPNYRRPWVMTCNCKSGTVWIKATKECAVPISSVQQPWTDWSGRTCADYYAYTSENAAASARILSSIIPKFLEGLTRSMLSAKVASAGLWLAIKLLLEVIIELTTGTGPVDLSVCVDQRLSNKTAVNVQMEALLNYARSQNWTIDESKDDKIGTPTDAGKNIVMLSCALDIYINASLLTNGGSSSFVINPCVYTLRNTDWSGTTAGQVVCCS